MKVGKKVGVLSRIGNKLNLQQKIMVYKSIVEPHFIYCTSILFLSYESDLSRLQILQNKCLRNILRMDKFTNMYQLLEITNFLSVKQSIIMYTLINIFKMINNIWPSNLSSKIKFKHHNERKRTLRCKNDLERKDAKKTCSQNSIFFKGIELYNKLPDDIKSYNCIFQFKKKIKEYVRKNF